MGLNLQALGTILSSRIPAWTGKENGGSIDPHGQERQSSAACLQGDCGSFLGGAVILHFKIPPPPAIESLDCQLNIFCPASRQELRSGRQRNQ